MSRNAIAITQTLAKRIFGDENPYGNKYQT